MRGGRVRGGPSAGHGALNSTHQTGIRKIFRPPRSTRARKMLIHLCPPMPDQKQASTITTITLVAPSDHAHATSTTDRRAQRSCVMMLRSSRRGQRNRGTHAEDRGHPGSQGHGCHRKKICCCRPSFFFFPREGAANGRDGGPAEAISRLQYSSSQKDTLGGMSQTTATHLSPRLYHPHIVCDPGKKQHQKMPFALHRSRVSGRSGGAPRAARRRGRPKRRSPAF